MRNIPLLLLILLIGYQENVANNVNVATNLNIAELKTLEKIEKFHIRLIVMKYKRLQMILKSICKNTSLHE
jgi:hypothetical protein